MYGYNKVSLMTANATMLTLGLEGTYAELHL